MPQRKKKTPKKWSLQPALHGDVVLLLEPDVLDFDFHNFDAPSRSIRDYDTNIMGRFICPNESCSINGWSSKMIATSIRLYANNEYNARVYHQRCDACNSLARPILNSTYAERVAYRLKKWSGVEVEQPNYTARSNGPHLSDRCEGCRDGHCSMRRRSRR